MIFVVKTAIGQHVDYKALINNELYIAKPNFITKINFASDSFSRSKHATKPVLLTINKFAANSNAPSFSLISSDYYTRNFGFFCKKELQLEKLTKVPLKFRLGSVQQCDRLEGKGNNNGIQ